MEYVRKHRWTNYYDYKCKEYLRNDFSHECAYCRFQEQEAGLVGLDFFEKDHFIPQSSNVPNVHNYENLYYACRRCNGAKSDINVDKLLDPCADNIFSGDNPAIIGGKKEDDFIFVPCNDRGSYYIDAFQLNSRRQIQIRESREKHQNNIKIINNLIDEILLKFRERPDLSEISALIGRLDTLRKTKELEISTLQKSSFIQGIETYLHEKNIDHSLVFEEYNMDIKVTIEGHIYYCELVLDSSGTSKEEYRKNIPTDKLNTWFNNLLGNFGILFYYQNLDRVYFYPISKLIKATDINIKNKTMQIKIDATNLL